MPRSSKQSRSKRFRISIRPDGNATNPNRDFRSSTYGDPVNFFYPVTDTGSASAARENFLDDKGVYVEADEDTINRSVLNIAGRLNRLLRKFNVPALEPSALMTFALTDPGNNPYRSTLPVMLNTDSLTGDILIPAARVADLWHPWYGVLNLDDDLFDSFIDNWETKVAGRELSVDIDHGRGGFGTAAMAWVNDVFLDKKTFMMQAEPTSIGRENLGSVFQYASIEYQDNFVDPETDVSYGPTLLGLAATNKPFVRGNPPMHFVPPRSALSDQSGRFYSYSHKESQMSNRRSSDGDQTFQIGDRTLTEAQILAIAEENDRLQATAKTGRIDTARQVALARGVSPALVGLAVSLMDATEPSAQPSLTLAVPGSEDKAEERQFNYFGAIEVMLSVVPGRMDDEAGGDEGGSNVENPRQPDYQPNLYSSEAGEGKTTEELEAEAIERRKVLGITSPSANGIQAEPTV